MKKLLWMIVLLLISITVGRAQVEGTVKDGESGKEIEFANVRLLDKDSLFIEGMLTDAKGSFMIKHKLRGDCILTITCMGYESVSLNLKNASGKVNLGEISMNSSLTYLREVVVKGSQVSRKDDRVLVFPSQLQKKHAANGYEILSNLNLPKVNVDLLNYSVTTVGGNVTLCINGREVSADELRSLLPEDILRVEYHDFPTGRFVGKVAVVDFITKQHERGGNFLLSADQRLTYPKGSYLAMARFNKNTSEYGVGYKFEYNYDTRNKREIHETFVFPDGLLRREEYSLPYQKKNNSHNLFCNYSFRKDSVGVNLYAGVVHQQIPNYEIVSIQNYSGRVEGEKKSRELSSSRYISPYFNAYYNRTFKNKSSLFGGLNFTYWRNGYERAYTQHILDIISQVNEDFVRISGGGSYQYWLGKNDRMTLQLYHFQDFTDVDYQGSYESRERLSSGQTLGWLEYFRKWDRTSVSASLGGSYSFYQQNGAKPKGFFSFRPLLTIEHSINDRNTVQLRSFMGNSSPWLAYISDVEQQVDDLLVRRGNPNLKQMMLWTNMLSYWLNVKPFNLSFFIRDEIFTLNQRADMYYDEGRFVSTYINDGRYNNLGVGTSISGSFLDASLRLKVDMGYNKAWVTNSVVGSLGYWYANFSGSYSIKDFMIRAYYYSPYRQMQYNKGDTYRKSSHYGFSLSYNHKGLSMTTGVQNPFSRLVQVTEKHHKVYTSKHQNIDSSNGVIGFLRLSYNFSYGRKYKYSDVKTNVGSTSAILKGSRD